MRAHWILTFITLTACTTRNPKFCGDGTCTDPALPFCDTDGSLEGTPGTCIAVSCSPGTFAACRGDDTLVCNSTGDDYDIIHCDTGCKAGITTCNPCKPGDVSCGSHDVETCGTDGLPHTSETCDVGCVAGPPPHCGYLEPKYLPNACDAIAVEPALTFSSSATLSTDLDQTCNGGIVGQEPAPDLCVLRYGTITVNGGVTLTVTGRRALVLVADSSLDVQGIVDASGTPNGSGPGGGISNPGTGAGSGNDLRGGGGAGFATKGGDGSGTPVLAGGPASTNPALLTALIGGANGGFPTSTGNAGGALMLVACRGTITVTGVLAANGGGGLGEGTIVTSGGGGGGSGGNVVLQGLDIQVTGQLFANGGGGGGGKANDSPGQNGRRDTTAAAGNDGGGNGGVANLSPTNANATSGSGGGGSVGFLQTYTPAGVTPTLSPSKISPNFQPSLTVPTR